MTTRETKTIQQLEKISKEMSWHRQQGRRERKRKEMGNKKKMRYQKYTRAPMTTTSVSSKTSRQK